MDLLSSSLVASAFPIVIGGVTAHFKLFIESPKDFRERCKLKKESLIEKHALQHTELLQHLKSIVGTDSELRGDGREARDLVGDYSSDTFRLFIISFRLELLNWIVGLAFSLMMLSVIAGILGALIACFYEPARNAILWASLCTVIVQIIVISIIYFSSRRLEAYIDVT